MKLVAAVCLAAVLAAPALSAPSRLYFPLTEGATWTLRNQDGLETSVAMVDRKTIRGIPCTVQEGRSVRGRRELVVQNCYAATAREVLLLETGTPVRMTTYRWVREEVVRVPAGTFKVWNLQTTRSRAGRITVVHSWYAAGVGLVKLDTVPAPGAQTPERGSELVSYRIP